MSTQLPTDSAKSSTDDPTELSDEDIHTVLSNPRRREVIDLLRTNGSEMSVREISERIAASESGQAPAPRKVKQSVYVSLLQTHLPKLDEFRVIEYDSQRKSVRSDEGLSSMTVFLETVPKYGITWSEYYAALALLGIVTIIGAGMEAPLISIVSAEIWGIGFLGLVLGSGLYRTIRQG